MAAIVRELKRDPDPDVVSFLKGALARAEAGDTTGILILEQDPNGLAYVTAGMKDRFSIIGWLSHAMFKLQEEP